MQAFTIGQNKALEDHLVYCREILAENERSIEAFEKGDMRIGSKTASGDRDITSEWIATLKRHNESLRRVIEAFKPAEFQTQVKS